MGDYLTEEEKDEIKFSMNPELKKYYDKGKSDMKKEMRKKYRDMPKSFFEDYLFN